MKTIYLAPYVCGPVAPAMSVRQNAPSQTTAQNPAVIQKTKTRVSIGSLLAGLAPLKLVEQSQTLLAIEVALVGIAVGTVLAWLAGVMHGWQVGVLLVDIWLAATLLVGYLVVTWRARTAHTTAEQPALSGVPSIPWAYRAVNYSELQATGRPRLVPHSTAKIEITDQLHLQAVMPDMLATGEVVLVESGQVIPADGKVVEGMAVVDESAVTGQSAPVVRDDNGSRHVMRDSRVIAGQIFVEVATRRGHPLDWIGGVLTGATPHALARR